ncbi:diguanylate cyclase [Herbaspirillum huttiense F1]|uniref:diguanylate cyclase n=1 Tax=Herbaspirillum huttiense subsp. lycopersici TaxID=3074428 RepID=A0ABU2EJD1_9BURK|nr:MULTISPECIES: GGDEF domain-containing protein [Herbaspirillum]MBP1314361.1 diguanylate cyclase (GGDEF)-like protein/PAS domain S-box-containing protein [Herbaspirillum sp. 1130]MDR9847970.1 diguanylate cyclase [Herbaspirillum huttiense SE1]MDT0354454.1 diguanylate cyclase [Herbaspirillum huttiense F1]
MRSTLTELGAELALYSIDAVSDMIIWLDEDGFYVFVNKAATEFLGYTSQELSQLRVCDIDPDFDEVRWKDHWKELEIKQSVCLETTNRNKSGQIIPIEVNASLVQFEGKKFNCSIVRNISERKRTEASLLALNKQIYLLSITDDLTQIANRRYFDEVFKRELQRALEQNIPFSLVLIDVDYFKAFNDLYGHIQGDHCLKRVAATISALIQSTNELAARYGGEEFVCILPGMSPNNVLIFGERLRQAIQDLAIPHNGSSFGTITVSIGVSTLEIDSNISTENLLFEADQHLYRAKANGRNRVEGKSGR